MYYDNVFVIFYIDVRINVFVINVGFRICCKKNIFKLV